MKYPILLLAALLVIPQAVGEAHPTECDRMAVAQIEYRGDLRLDILSNWGIWPLHYRNARGNAAWVLFADAGRGWKVGAPDGSMLYESNEMPPLSTWTMGW